MLNALLAERCDQSCYLRRPADCSAGKLRRTCSAVPLPVSVVRMAVACWPAARPDSNRTDLFSNHPPAADFARQLQRLALTVDCPLALAGEAAELASEQLAGSTIACLGNDARSLSRRLLQLLNGHMDT